MKVVSNSNSNTPNAKKAFDTPNTKKLFSTSNAINVLLQCILVLIASTMHSLAAPEEDNTVTRDNRMLDKTIGHLMQYNNFSWFQEMTEADLLHAGGLIEVDENGKKKLFLNVNKLNPEGLYLRWLPMMGNKYSIVSIICNYDFERSYPDGVPRINSILVNLKILHYCLLNLSRMDFEILWLSKDETKKGKYSKEEIHTVYKYMDSVMRSPKIINRSIEICVTEKHGSFWTPLLFEMLLRSCWFMDISKLLVKVPKWSSRTSLFIPRFLPDGCTVSMFIIWIGDYENPVEFDHYEPGTNQEYRAHSALLDRVHRFLQHQITNPFFQLPKIINCPNPIQSNTITSGASAHDTNSSRMNAFGRSAPNTSAFSIVRPGTSVAFMNTAGTSSFSINPSGTSVAYMNIAEMHPPTTNTAIPAVTNCMSIEPIPSTSTAEPDTNQLLFIAPIPFTVKFLKINLGYAYYHLFKILSLKIRWVPDWISDQVTDSLCFPVFLVKMAPEFFLTRIRAKKLSLEVLEPEDTEGVCEPSTERLELPALTNTNVLFFWIDSSVQISRINIEKYPETISKIISWIILQFPAVEKISIAYANSRQHALLQNIRALPNAQSMTFKVPTMFPSRLQSVEVDYREYLCNGYVPIVIDPGMFYDYKSGAIKKSIKKTTSKKFLEKNPFIYQTLEYTPAPGTTEGPDSFFYCPQCCHLIIPRSVVYIPTIIPNSVLPTKYARIFLTPSGYALCFDCIEALRMETTNICCLPFYTTYIYNTLITIRNKSMYYSVIHKQNDNNLLEYHLSYEKVTNQGSWLIDCSKYASEIQQKTTRAYESDSAEENTPSYPAIAGCNRLAKVQRRFASD